MSNANDTQPRKQVNPRFTTRTHGASKTRMFRAWVEMRRRCRSRNRKGWKDWGGRGITVCEAWQSFEPFRDHVRSLLPAGAVDIPAGLGVDRIDNDKGYEPGNVRLATPTVNNRNRRNVARLTIDGQTKSIAEWAEEHGIRMATVRQRLRNGWDARRAVFVPARPYGRSLK